MNMLVVHISTQTFRELVLTPFADWFHVHYFTFRLADTELYIKDPNSIQTAAKKPNILTVYI